MFWREDFLHHFALYCYQTNRIGTLVRRRWCLSSTDGTQPLRLKRRTQRRMQRMLSLSTNARIPRNDTTHHYPLCAAIFHNAAKDRIAIERLQNGQDKSFSLLSLLFATNIEPRYVNISKSFKDSSPSRTAWHCSPGVSADTVVYGALM